MISPVHEELCVDIYFLSDVIEFLALGIRYDLYSLLIYLIRVHLKEIQIC